MTGIPIDTPEEAVTPADQPVQAHDPGANAGRPPSVHSVLEKLFQLYPHLFGPVFLPLKLGIFQELLARHPDDFKRETLKAALGVHTRSARYLQSVAAGNKRHDLQGAAVGDVAPEHIHWALLELSRRKQARSKEDLRPRLRVQLMAAFEASGLTRQDYLAKIQTRDVEADSLMEQAFAELDHKLAKQEALRRAFDSSGKTLEEFCDMYGVDPRDVTGALARKPPPPAVGA